MDITLYVDQKRYDEISQNGFPASLGQYAHNIAVMIMRYDTGNAKSAISLTHNSPKSFTIDYNLLKAKYVKFLDEGVGPVKKHKGIVSVLTVGAIAEEMVGWILSGTNPTFTSPPVVALRQSKYRPFSAKSSVTGLSEKNMLQYSSMNSNAISASARSEINKVREYTYLRLQGGKIKGTRGVKTETTKLQNDKTIGGNRNISILKSIAKDQKRQYKEHRERVNDAINMRGVK